MKLGLKKVALFPGMKRIFSWSSLEVACCVSQLVSWERTGLCRYRSGKSVVVLGLFWISLGLFWFVLDLFWLYFWRGRGLEMFVLPEFQYASTMETYSH